MCTSDTGQHGGKGVVYILTVNISIPGNITTITHHCMVKKRNKHLILIFNLIYFSTHVTTPFGNLTLCSQSGLVNTVIIKE